MHTSLRQDHAVVKVADYPKAYSYVRFSTLEQRNGDSLRRQTELSEKYAAEHGLVLDNSLRLEDLGISAYSGKHLSDKAALGQFLKLVEMGKVEKGSVLLVENLDRLSRQEITKALQQFLDIINNGIKIVTLIDNREYTQQTVNDNVGELICSLAIMARAHEESATKSKRLKSAWEKKRGQTGTRKLTSMCPAWLKLDKTKTKFEIIESRKKIVCRIFDMKLAGKGVTRIVKELNGTPDDWKHGSTNIKKQDEGWRESYVRKILQNRAVIGEFQPHRLTEGKREPIGEIISDYFPPVIDKDVFYRVQEQFSQNLHKGGRNGKINNLFSHIAKCGYCGGPMAFTNKEPGSPGGQYLICDRARRKSIDCCNLSIRYDEFERLILTYCKGLQPKDILTRNDDSAITLLKDELDGKTGELNSITVEIDNLADSIATTLDKRVRRTLEDKIKEKLDRQDFLAQRINEINQRINILSRSLLDPQMTLESLRELLAFLNTATETKELIDVRLKLRNEIRRLIERIDIYPGGNPFMTADRADETLKVISQHIKNEEDVKGYAVVKEQLRQQVEKPRAFRCFTIRFVSGNYRLIYPSSRMPLRFDVDKETGVLHHWCEMPDGTVSYKELCGRV